MDIYPAIDIKNGQCVRLLQGRADAVTVYGADVASQARQWMEQGAKYIHMVDLDGAFTGKAGNLEAVRQAVRSVTIPVQLGGGIRTMDDIEKRLEETGVSRVILGTVACREPQLVKEAAARYGGARIAVGIDAAEGRVAVQGWVEKTSLRPVELALRMRDAGIETIIYTDVSRDGMLGGVNIDATQELVEKTGLQIIASGGIGSLEDVRAVGRMGAAGVIIGKALYSGKIDLPSALSIAAAG